MTQLPDIKDRAVGRWKGILAGLGMEARALTGQHGPCPMCGGKDRWRFDDKDGRGTFFCSACGAGNGVDLVMRWKGVDFIGAKGLIEGQIGTAPVVVPRAGGDAAEQKAAMKALWLRARPLDGLDVASRYLTSRGITMPVWPASLRVIDDLAHRSRDGVATRHPAMLAKFVAHDDSGSMLHRTWLAEPGVKADVDVARKMMPGPVPPGGALRLWPAAETIGIAEGIETALAAGLLWGVPVWAALTAGALIKWIPPAGSKHVIIFGDTDPSGAGQNAAYSLAYRLHTERIGWEVRFPGFYDTGLKEDWSDQLMAQLRDAA